MLEIETTHKITISLNDEDFVLLVAAAKSNNENPNEFIKTLVEGALEQHLADLKIQRNKKAKRKAL